MASLIPTAGILDTYFVIQGAPTGVYTGGGGSSLGVSDDEPFIDLCEILPISGYNRYTFRAVYGDRYWLLVFDIPLTGGMGRVYNSDPTDCLGVIIFDTELLYSGGPVTLAARMEPGRAEWHTEQLDALSLYNISRCHGVEDTALEILAVTFAGAILLEDGYNTEWTFTDADTELALTAAAGIGQGRCPDFGDTVPCGGSSESGAPDLVSTINGIAPKGGDIPIDVSNSLGIRRSPGLIEIVVKS